MSNRPHALVERAAIEANNSVFILFIFLPPQLESDVNSETVFAWTRIDTIVIGCVNLRSHTVVCRDVTNVVNSCKELKTCNADLLEESRRKVVGNGHFPECEIVSFLVESRVGRLTCRASSDAAFIPDEVLRGVVGV